MRIYLDNCCYNRPYDDQSKIRIHLETEAKLHIQELIRSGMLELVTSFILDYENDRNRFLFKKQAIQTFTDGNSSFHVSSAKIEDIKIIAGRIMQTGVKEKDAYHVACAKMARCDFFVTTDDRLLKYQDEAMPLVTPGELLRRLEAGT